jgi:hypothetical protein
MHSIHSKHTYMVLVIKCLCGELHANASRSCVKKKHYIHTCSIRTQLANNNHRVCLRFTHLAMKQFLSLFKFKWLKPLNTQRLAFCTQVKSPNPNSNPNAPNYTILQKDSHNVCLKSYPKQDNK